MARSRDKYPEYAPDKGSSLAELAQARRQMLDEQRKLNADLSASGRQIELLGKAYSDARRAGNTGKMAQYSASLQAAEAQHKKLSAGQDPRRKELESGLAKNEAEGRKKVEDSEEGSGAMKRLSEAATLAAESVYLIAGVKVAEELTAFVGALNPSAVQVFAVALKDLEAVVGVALMPTFSVLTQSVKQFGNLLLPLAEQLAPVFGQLSQSVLQVAQPIMQTLVNAVRTAAPALQLFADIVSLAAPPLQAMQTVAAAVFQTLADAFSSLFGAGYKDAMSQAQSAMQKFANYMLVGVGAVLKFAASLGVPMAGKFLGNLIEAAKGGRQKSAEGLGAATQGRTTDVRSFESSQLAAAFTATQGTDPKKTQEEFLGEAVQKLEAIQSGALDAKEALRQIGRDIVAAIKTGINDILRRMGLPETF